MGDYPLGYVATDKGRGRDLEPIKTEQKAVARIVELRQAGRSYREIATALDAEGNKPRSGRAQHHASEDQRLTVPQGVRSPGVLRGAPGSLPVSKAPVATVALWLPMRPSQMPNRRSLRAKSRRARRKSTRRNSGQYGSTNTHSAYAACQSKKPDSRASPLVLITRSGSGRSAV